jgi:hypothetical protein
LCWIQELVTNTGQMQLFVGRAFDDCSWGFHFGWGTVALPVCSVQPHGLPSTATTSSYTATASRCTRDQAVFFQTSAHGWYYCQQGIPHVWEGSEAGGQGCSKGSAAVAFGDQDLHSSCAEVWDLQQQYSRTTDKTNRLSCMHAQAQHARQVTGRPKKPSLRLRN